MAENQDHVFKEFIELEVFADLKQGVIVTTEDKLNLTLSKYYSKIGRKKDWIAPFGISITILTVLITASFNEVIFSGDTWQAVFLIIFIASIVWLGMTLKYAFKESKIEDVIAELKNNKNPE